MHYIDAEKWFMRVLKVKRFKSAVKMSEKH